MFHSLKKIIPQSLRASGIERQVSASFVTEEAKRVLERLWGVERASYVEPVSFSGGVLLVRMTSPSAAQAFRMIETTWMNEINRSLGERKVMKIEIRR